jgi:alkanesulfonate monooxygenase SsuD/methylene tetrahydromethanopterin reductase-like flavin-dependent oxidoreductase (luciferase family)
VATNKVAAYTLVHCAETNDQARENGVWESVAWWYQNIAEFTLNWELPHLDPAAQEASFPLLKPLMEGNIPIESFDAGDMIVVGDPERCFEKMKHYADLGVDELICYVQFGYHSPESTLKTIELLGKEVLPELEKYTPVDVGANLAEFID